MMASVRSMLVLSPPATRLHGGADRRRASPRRGCPPSRSAFIFSAAVPLPPEMIAPGVAHAAPGRRGLPGDEGDDRLGHVLPGRRRRPLPRPCRRSRRSSRSPRSARSSWNSSQHVDEVGADDRVAADADAGRLADAEVGQLPDGLVGQRARAGDDADRARACGCARA